MKTINQIKRLIATSILTLVAINFLTSCSPKASEKETVNASNQYSPKLLTNCNKTSSTDMSVQSSVVSYYNQIDNNSIKLKFTSASALVLKEDVSIRFYKWKVENGVSSLDQTALQFYQYDLATQYMTSGWTNSIIGSALDINKGLVINLNDYSGTYQVLKVVAFDSTGKSIAEINHLIPAFYASPIDYQHNANGTVRPTILQSLHPLHGTNQSSTEAQAYLNQFCF